MRFLATLLVASAILTPITVVKAAAAPALASPEASSEVRLPHISIVTIGKGRPVLLIPGLGTPRAVWGDVAARLASSHEVILVQVNGFAGDAPGDNLADGVLNGIVGDLHKYLSMRDLGPVRLIGHSMGGLVGLIYAEAHPADVGRLMVVDALPYFPVLMARDGVVPGVAEMEPLANAARAEMAAAYGKPADAKAAQANVKGLALKPASLARMTKWALAADPRVVGQVFYEDLTTDMRPKLNAIKAPVTVVFASNENGLGRDKVSAFFKRQYATIENAAYVDIDDSGHFVMLDQPEQFDQAVTDFAR